MKKILVTGGAGFVGSHLCKRLLDTGNEVFCLDNLCTGSIENIKPLFSDTRFHFVERDVTETYDERIDEIYNLACPASPPQYQKDPIRTIKTSLIGVFNLLELAKKYNAKFLQASTSEIYGNPIEHPQSENYYGNVNTVGKRSCYDESKRCSETIIYEYNNNKEFIKFTTGSSSAVTLTTDSNTKYIKIRAMGGVGQNSTTVKYQIEEGNVATAYEPYILTSSTIVTQNKNHTLTAIWEPVSNP